MDLIIKIIIILFFVIILLTIIYFSMKDDKLPPDDNDNINKSEYTSNNTLNSVKNKHKKANKSEYVGNIHENEKLSDMKEIKNNQGNILYHNKHTDNFHEIISETPLINEQTNNYYFQEPITESSSTQSNPISKSSAAQLKPITKLFGVQTEPITESSGTQSNPMTKSSAAQLKPITKLFGAQTEPITESSGTQRKPLTKPFIANKKPVLTKSNDKKNFTKGTLEINKPNQQNVDNQIQETIYNLIPFVPPGYMEYDPFKKQNTIIETKPDKWVYKSEKTGDEDDFKKIFLQEPQYVDIHNYQEIISMWKNSSFFSYIKDKSQINFNHKVWLPFKSKTIEELRNKLYTILRNENIEKFKTNSTIVGPVSNDKGINTLTMNDNACYLISIIYMIKANTKLLEFINIHCNDNIYKKTLLDYLKKGQVNCMTKEEFNILVNFPHWGFKFNVQDDPNMFLQCLLKNKCDISKLQFAFFGNLLITKTGTITNDETYNIEEIVHFSASSFGLTFPILELFMNKPGFNYNIKNILWGTKTNILTPSQENLYLMPIFTTAPPFLCIKIGPGDYNIKDTDDFPVYENGKIIRTDKKPVYKFYKHGNLVFQNEIYLRSLLDKESKYKLTGFLVYRLYKSPNNLNRHYIPYFKIGDKWLCNYFDERKDVTNEINFPLNMEDDERFIVSSLFYERLT